MPKGSKRERVIRVAVDAMGGDYAPEEIVKGVVRAAQEMGVEIILVGPVATVEEELAKYDVTNPRIKIADASDFIREGEHPALALRHKPNASVAVATRLVKTGEADAMLSAGSTGAVVVSALQILGTVGGLGRPVVGGPFIGFAPNTVVMDGGGNIDCKPYQFLDFAIVGTVYARKLLHVDNPTVALLSIGAEEGKGNELVRESYPLFQKSGLNFIGNIEGHDLLSGRANVVICDGFTGNVMFKFCEGLGTTIAQWLETKLKGKLPATDIENLITDLLSLTNAADTLGGVPLWGINGVAVVSHGRSKAREITGAISQAKAAVESDLIPAMKSELARIRKATQG